MRLPAINNLANDVSRMGIIRRPWSNLSEERCGSPEIFKGSSVRIPHLFPSAIALLLGHQRVPDSFEDELAELGRVKGHGR
jgi:hypothetical protein